MLKKYPYLIHPPGRIPLGTHSKKFKELKYRKRNVIMKRKPSSGFLRFFKIT
jgi:hypothetical protein